MDLKPLKASCVIVGSFNIYIFQPEWVSRLMGLGKTASMEVETDLSSPGVKLTSEAFKWSWEIRPDRLTVESADESVDLGDPIARVVRKLPETPLRAIGHNFSFSVPEDQLCPNALSEAYNSRLPSDLQLRKSGTIVVAAHGVHTYAIGLIRDSEKTKYVTTVNVSTELGETSSETAERDAMAFLDHRSRGLTFVDALWGKRPS